MIKILEILAKPFSIIVERLSQQKFYSEGLILEARIQQLNPTQTKICEVVNSKIKTNPNTRVYLSEILLQIEDLQKSDLEVEIQNLIELGILRAFPRFQLTLYGNVETPNDSFDIPPKFRKFIN
jgi:hypothetical protein